MVGPLISGRIARVHAEKLLGPLVIEEAWVSGIEVKPVVSASNATTTEPTASYEQRRSQQIEAQRQTLLNQLRTAEECLRGGLQ